MSVLVRNKDKGAKLAREYPQVRVVHGDLDSADVIEQEVKNADIVYRMYYSCKVLPCWNMLKVLTIVARLCRLRP